MKDKGSKKEHIKVGGYKTVFKGLICQIQQAKAVFPDGSIKIFERVSRSPSVVILALNSQNHLLLNREYRLKFNRYMWRLPGGRVEGKETPLETAQKELREETGFRAGKLKLFHLFEHGSSIDWQIYAYLATDLISDPLKNEEFEDITTVPTSLKDAWGMVLEGEIESEVMAYLILKLYHHRKKYIK